jgi:hypothetical protein
MIDRIALKNQLEEVRQYRMDAQAAGCEVEELISAVQHFQPGKQRLVFICECGEPELFGSAH